MTKKFIDCVDRMKIGKLPRRDATKMLLEECSIIYLAMLREEVSTFVTAVVYKYYWKRTK